MNIYLACALTHVPRKYFTEYAELLHRLADHLSRVDGHDVKYALMNSDPQLATKPINERARLCYLWDSRMVQEADVLIAECSFPSIGLGIELQIAAQNEIPIIMLYREIDDNRAVAIHYTNPDSTEHELQIGGGFISLMALGVPTVFKVHQSSQKDDAISQISESIKLLEP